LATYLWVGDLNLTRDPGLDNEKRRPAPAPRVARALDHLNVFSRRDGHS